jgi:hypothetical protein
MLPIPTITLKMREKSALYTLQQFAYLHPHNKLSPLSPLILAFLSPLSRPNCRSSHSPPGQWRPASMAGWGDMPLSLCPSPPLRAHASLPPPTRRSLPPPTRGDRSSRRPTSCSPSPRRAAAGSVRSGHHARWICRRRPSALRPSPPSAPRHGGRAGAMADGDMAFSPPSVLSLLAGASRGAGVEQGQRAEQEQPRWRGRGCRAPVTRANSRMQEGMGVTAVGIALLGCDFSLSSPS